MGRANMIISQTPNSAAEGKRVARLEVARRVYQALVAQDPDRLITLRDGGGREWLATIRGLSRVIQRLPHSCAHVVNSSTLPEVKIN